MFEQPSSSSDIIRSEEYLKPSYTPDKPVGRDQHIKRIANAIRPITRRQTPENLFIHGPAGVGKTTCVKHVFDQLEEQTGAKSLFINCWQYNTRSSLLTELLIQLGYPAPRKGKPVDVLLSKIREWLDKNRGVAVALDEFDQLDNQTQLVYDLQIVDRDADNSLGLIMVSNQPLSEIDLDPRSESRLNCQTLRFRPYDKRQLKKILKQRVEHAFHPGSVSEEVIEVIAEHVAENTGHCRDALNLLRQAGRTAEETNCSKLTEEIVEKVIG